MDEPALKRARNTDNTIILQKYRGYRPNFAELAQRYPDTFGSHVTYLDDEKKDAVIDWEDPVAARAVTKTLLRHDFGLDWDIPLERLCPPVPNRLNYICWLKELLLLDNLNMKDEDVKGIDIGVGSSAIYPLLGHQVFGWSFLGTDIDRMALESAQANINRNNLQHKIQVKHVQRADYSSTEESDVEGPILKALDGSSVEEKFDFSMCNPPFFASMTEIRQQDTKKHGLVDELITPGGEVAFVKALVRDSLKLRHGVRWYTTMVGKKATLKPILALLREKQVVNVRTTEFLQGRTTRWGLAWSFGEDGLAELQGAKASQHKVFGRKKLEKKRETVQSFVVRPTTVEEEVLDEAVVGQRVKDFLLETRQLHVTRVGEAVGGAEELYRKVWLAETSSIILPAAESPVRQEIPVNIPASDPNWKKKCVVLITMVAGAAAEEEEEEESEKMKMDQGGSAAGVKVTVEMRSGGDVSTFWKLCDVMAGEVARTNRRWRRKLKETAAATTT